MNNISFSNLLHKIFTTVVYDRYIQGGDEIEVKKMWGLLIIQLVLVGYLWCYLSHRAEELAVKEEG